MTDLNPRTIVLATALLAIAAIFLAIAPVFAIGGDYGVNTGATAQSTSACAGNPCTINVNGYGLTFSHVDSYGSAVYTFDDFDCTVYIHSNGLSSGRGPECDQYQPNN